MGRKIHSLFRLQPETENGSDGCVGPFLLDLAVVVGKDHVECREQNENGYSQGQPMPYPARLLARSQHPCCRTPGRWGDLYRLCLQ